MSRHEYALHVYLDKALWCGHVTSKTPKKFWNIIYFYKMTQAFRTRWTVKRFRQAWCLPCCRTMLGWRYRHNIVLMSLYKVSHICIHDVIWYIGELRDISRLAHGLEPDSTFWGSSCHSPALFETSGAVSKSARVLDRRWTWKTCTYGANYTYVTNHDYLLDLWVCT